MMDVRTEPEILTRLAEMPDLLNTIAATLSAVQIRRRPATGGFSFVEHAWHLADLEREGYGVRIARLLAEESPHLPDFPGARIAREREYQDSDPAPALALFASARRRNLARLRTLPEPAFRRSGTQEAVGPLTLGDVPRMMAAHDHEHVAELAALVAAIAPDATILPWLRERAATPPPPARRAPSSRPVAA